MSERPHTKAGECNAPESEENTPEAAFESADPNDSSRLRDELKGQTKEHATPPRLEDEGQPGG